MLGAIVVVSALVEGVGTMGVAGTTGLMVALVGILKILDGTKWCPL